MSQAVPEPKPARKVSGNAGWTDVMTETPTAAIPPTIKPIGNSFSAEIHLDMYPAVLIPPTNPKPTATINVPQTAVPPCAP